jgi:hypothetical protein
MYASYWLDLQVLVFIHIYKRKWTSASLCEVPIHVTSATSCDWFQSEGNIPKFLLFSHVVGKILRSDSSE